MALPTNMAKREYAGDLMKRTSFPVTVDAKLKADISAAIKADIKANVLAKISASVSEQVKATLDVKVSALGGIISIGDAKLSIEEDAQLKKLAASVEASIEAKLGLGAYADIDVQLDRLLGNKKTCSEKDLETIIAKLEAKLIAKLKVELPKICLGLKADIKAAVDLCIKNLEINIPLLLDIKVSASVKVNAIVKLCADVAVKVCAKLDAKVCAKAVIGLL
ncbi:hypothetical protein DM01DRAFT_1377005 [Hesseltinella vesiculosa]|uniref:Uncharacterized protein n=1 Tax=Hesseltinella vesiculosa TaxID=101127 RepID=A0A1X2G8X5_9FUNG|nr:hypothetical protein DM01DRAFT_1377005 [Hesseltinella vesiculosa]